MSRHRYYTVDVNMDDGERSMWFPVVPTDGRSYLFSTKPKALAFWYDLPGARAADALKYRISEHLDPDHD